MRSALISLTYLSVLSVVPAQAQNEIECNKESIMELEKRIAAGEAGNMEKFAINHLEHAKKSLEKGRMVACRGQIGVIEKLFLR